MSPVRVENDLGGVDWVRAKADLVADKFDNGRSADALRRSFEQSQHVAVAFDGDHCVGMARLLGLQTDDAQPFYATLGFRPQPEFLSLVVGQWLDNDANR